ncbi:hypothetical protein CBR_g11035 [Chara braunii]|uniref:Uncharacterized protein n=1 Tax=Chara braunii TaxID=69332 RepID=A0A388KPY9_CHABU|nr:hypothetical protein CBR_g11035 [Chara braunii]|eukprot:GBG72102.1 hypothetical protein CBR_g11035 [Chara braunii]
MTVAIDAEEVRNRLVAISSPPPTSQQAMEDRPIARTQSAKRLDQFRNRLMAISDYVSDEQEKAVRASDHESRSPPAGVLMS